MPSSPDPYVITEDRIVEPPQTVAARLRHLGPSFILSASIVGSGELIATTTLGAQAGFVAFWIILVSCMVKVAIQLEFGKHAIHTGESVMTALNRLPGPRIGETSWSIWSWLLLMVFKFLQLGGIIGGVALTLNIAFPGISIAVWAIVAAIAVASLVFRGHYRFIEKFSIVLIGFFTLMTLASLYFLQFTEYALGWQQIATGLSLDLPAAIVPVAIAAFGITGVGGDEIMIYTNWCIEKGYAGHAGPKADTEAWLNRVRGWIRVMHLDAIIGMVIYTIVTAAFYLLGAAVLHAQGTVPEGYSMIETLSSLYTETLGGGAKLVFLAGAVIVLFSTMFAALAAWIRMFADAFGQVGWLDFYNVAARERAYAIMAWSFPALWVVLFLFIKLPVLMVVIGGVMTSIILLIVVFAAFDFRYRRLIPELRPGKLYDAVFWLSGLVIAAVGVYGIVKLI